MQNMHLVEKQGGVALMHSLWRSKEKLIWKKMYMVYSRAAIQ